MSKPSGMHQLCFVGTAPEHLPSAVKLALEQLALSVAFNHATGDLVVGDRLGGIMVYSSCSRSDMRDCTKFTCCNDILIAWPICLLQHR